MHLAVDATHLTNYSRFRGVGTFLKSLLLALAETSEELKISLLARVPPEDDAFQREPFSFVKAPGMEEEFSSTRFFKRQIEHPLWLRKQPFDLYWVPFSPDAPVIQSLPTVVTVHDLIIYYHIRLPRYRFASVIMARLKHNRAIRRAQRLMADSHATAREVTCRCNVKEDAIEVVYPGIDSRFKPIPEDACRRILSEHGLTPGYLLYVGAYEPYKNLSFLVDTFGGLARSNRVKVPLVLVGKIDKWGTHRELAAQVERQQLGNQVIFTDFVPYDHLPALYTGAAALVFPSLLEGFGLPPAEAMACGTPVICSNRTSLPEVVGDAGILFDPTDKEELGDAIPRLLDSEALQRDLQSRSLAQAAKFTWEKAATGAMNCFKAALGPCHPPPRA